MVADTGLHVAGAVSAEEPCDGEQNYDLDLILAELKFAEVELGNLGRHGWAAKVAEVAGDIDADLRDEPTR